MVEVGREVLDLCTSSDEDDDPPLQQAPQQPQQQQPPPPTPQEQPLPQQLAEQLPADLDSVATMVEWGYDRATAQRVLSVAVGIDADERIQNAMALLEGEEHNDMSSDPSDAEFAAALAAGAAIGSLIQKAFLDAQRTRFWETAKVLRYCAAAGHLLRYINDNLEERVILSQLPDKDWRRIAEPAVAGEAKGQRASRKRPRAQSGGGTSTSGGGGSSSHDHTQVREELTITLTLTGCKNPRSLFLDDLKIGHKISRASSFVLHILCPILRAIKKQGPWILPAVTL